MILFALGFTTGILFTLLIMFSPNLYKWFVYPKTYEGITRKATDEGIMRVLEDRN